MGFVALDASLMAYAKSTSIKLKLYTQDLKYSKDGFAPLPEEKIEKRETKVEK